MKSYCMAAHPTERTDLLIRSWLTATPDQDVDVRIGHCDDHDPAVMISIGKSDHAFTATEARIVADLAESAMHKFGHTEEGQSLANLIMALRLGADKATAKYAKSR